MNKVFARLLVSICIATTASAAIAQSYTFTTIAGSPGSIGDADGIGSAAQFSGPISVAVDGSGNVYVADFPSSTIRKISAAGAVTTLAGLAGTSGSADGTGSNARFDHPFGVAVDASGNVFVADRDNFTIRKITPGGTVTTIAGSAGNPGSVDGTGSAARFSQMQGVAVDTGGNLFVADYGNNTIRKITAGGVVTTLAGLAGTSGSADGTGSAARFNTPEGVAVDGAGNVFVADTFNHTIRKITAGGVVTTLAGSAGNIGSADGSGDAARFYYPPGVAVDSGGNVFVADYYNQTIRKISAGNVVTTLAGTAGIRGSADGTGAEALFNQPAGIAVDGTGNLFVADLDNSTIRKGTPSSGPPPPPPLTWTPTGSMNSLRVEGRAILLPNGKVMNAGGSSSAGFRPNSELYDPTTGTWALDALFPVPRYNPALVRLFNGKVLAAGGYWSGVSVHPGAEIYDWISQTWTVTSSMGVPRDTHTLTLLGDGKVLAAGGTDGGVGAAGILASAEAYDPASGTWTATGAMAQARASHTATLLTNGKVLVVGGWNRMNDLASAELYDPVTGTWTPTAPLAIGRTYHTANLLPNGKVLVSGGYNHSSILNSTEIYDPNTGSWTSGAPLHIGRYYHTATSVPSGAILAVGGEISYGVQTASAELYDPVQNTWNFVGPMSTARADANATLLADGARVLVEGGWSPNGTFFSSAEIFHLVIDEDGPVAVDAALNPSAVPVADLAAPITVTGWIDDRSTGASNISAAEVTFDGGTTWLPMSAFDGSFNSAYEAVTTTFVPQLHGIAVTGVYPIRIRGYDVRGNVSNEDCVLLAVYDPSAGFVTGAGWLTSPAGALASAPAATGRANFGFVSQYKKGANVPSGTTQFVFTAGGLSFESNSYEWLVVNENGSNAQFKGSGTINGTGTYGFMIWATDHGNQGTDTFRIRITGPGGVVYDNGNEQPIGGGNIVVHTPKK